MAGSKNGSSSRSKRGFAAMSAEERREIASKGGRASRGGGRRRARCQAGVVPPRAPVCEVLATARSPAALTRCDVPDGPQ